MKDGDKSDVVIMNFAMAFDKVSHEKLLLKLHTSGIIETTCAWTLSFLSDRTQRVVVDGEFTDEADDNIRCSPRVCPLTHFIPGIY